jgi:hypothetical protein
MCNAYYTQVEQSAKEPSRAEFFRGFHGSSIPANRSGDRIDPVPAGTYRNLSKPAAGYGHRIRGIFWRVPAGNSGNTASGIIVLGIYSSFRISYMLLFHFGKNVAAGECAHLHILFCEQF